MEFREQISTSYQFLKSGSSKNIYIYIKCPRFTKVQCPRAEKFTLVFQMDYYSPHTACTVDVRLEEKNNQTEETEENAV